MKNILIMFAASVFILGLSAVSYASDWDVAGKVLTGIEGLRIISGGNIDVIGHIAGINRNGNTQGQEYSHNYYRQQGQEYAHNHYRKTEHYSKVWVPHYVWVRRWVPGHFEYVGRQGKEFVPGHFVRYKVERGGHWEYARAVR